MKIKSLAIFLAAMSVAHVTHSADSFQMKDPRTSVDVSVTAADLANADKMRNFLVLAEGAEALFDTYLRYGYGPMDAMMLTNWDVSEGLRKATPGVPENLALKEKINLMKNSYQPVNGEKQ